MTAKRLKCPYCQRPMDPQQTLDDSDLWTCRTCRTSLCIEDFSDLTDNSYQEAWNQWYPNTGQ
jgi:ribosomal protein L37AE/L43A